MPTLPRPTQNPLSAIGIFLTTLGAVLFLTFFVLELFGVHANPYLGMVVFLVLPAVFVFGLLLIPLGAWRERRRRLRGLPPSRARWPKFDLNDRVTRRVVAGVAVLTVVNVVIVAIAGYKGVEYMDSPEFCGRVCHTVMEPEYTAYQDGPHSRVRCVECHIGPGAPWFVKAKIDGVRQVWAVALKSYSRPIPSPVHDLRPARDTCEHCHWPDKFTGDLVRSIPSYADDEANTAAPTNLRLRVGGGSTGFGGPHGIHWHTSRDHRVEYVATDDERETIPWVRLTDANGKVTEFVVEGTNVQELERRERRTMDCVDCHNRPSHRFQATPERAVDGAIQQGRLPSNLPFVRREAVAALKTSYADRDAAEREIRSHLETFYAKSYPDLVQAGDGRIAQAVRGVQHVWQHSVFPRMNVSWGAHPNHIGHTDSPGCFRCHDDLHKSADGRTIKQDCDLCHELME
ncbi:MAG TPA: NapC/NirT family cytochrome c [Candidatus Polarisedimenticolaceae bacterium]|nr:NapC/NirT family cytochrome c [Candidatus Polarisedimenticolaceae bacterium]